MIPIELLDSKESESEEGSGSKEMDIHSGSGSEEKYEQGSGSEEMGKGICYESVEKRGIH